MRFMIVNSDYEQFLTELYAQHEGLADKPYAEQLQTRMHTRFGVSDFYSHSLRALGHEVHDIHANNQPLQRSWLKSRGLNPRVSQDPPGLLPRLTRAWHQENWMSRVLAIQIREIRPDVLLNQDMFLFRSAFWKRVKSDIALLVGQLPWIYIGDSGSGPFSRPVGPVAGWEVYDLVVSSAQPTVETLRERGIPAELVRLAFDPRVLSDLSDRGPPAAVSFVGSLMPVHSSRVQWLEELCRELDVEIWTSDTNAVPDGSPLKPRIQGTAWGMEMYQVLRDSRITLNHHGNVPPFANNLRLFEATGVGTLLVTDAKPNLSEMFEPGREVVTYRSAAECAEIAGHYLQHESERAAIAAAGQARTLAEHTYATRMREFVALLEHQ